MLEHPTEERIPLLGAVILCDCQALPKALRGHNLAGVSESMIRLDELRDSGVELVVQWIPSHVGIIGNEIADTLANHGRIKASQRSLRPSLTALKWCAADWPKRGKPPSR